MMDCQFMSTCACSIGGSSYLMIADSGDQRLVTVCLLNCTGSFAAPGVVGAVVTNLETQDMFPIALSYSARLQELFIGARPTGSLWMEAVGPEAESGMQSYCLRCQRGIGQRRKGPVAAPRFDQW